MTVSSLSSQEEVTGGGCGSDLGDEDQAERDGAAEYDDQRHDAELDVGLVAGQEGNGGTDDAHDAHVVDTHADVLAVVERRDADVAGLPGQEAAKELVEVE